MKSRDDRRRPRFGLLFTAFEDEDGNIRFVMDDVEAADASGRLWKQHTFVTHESVGASQARFTLRAALRR
jgi:hypothetical protein